MVDVLPSQLPWWVVGPGLGFLVVGLFLVNNQPLGASGAYVQASGLLRRRPEVAVWRVWYFAGMFLGGLVVTQVLRDNAGGEVRSGYDSLTATFSMPVVVLLVLVGAVLLGYGAAVAGGCTSGHGLCGVSQRSPASLTMTATFVGTAVAVSLAMRALVGGAL
ncbi:MAG: YeeE/YedE thiosulfate transporter family protein [Acidimicrobiia bacterium]|nr:YeeE/YedE thiosulfate transporter family protein [Acidimicrobiia bacterium]MDH5519112.1 YeeE/YedE thiosulfate transporter family protein [Acidimicrobiia bacterium]